jgi:hypothetical protein
MESVVAAVVFALLPMVRAGTAYNDAVLSDSPVYYWTFDQSEGVEPNLGTAGSGGGANNLAKGATSTRVPSLKTPGGVTLGSDVLARSVSSDQWFSGTLTGGAINNRYAIELWVKSSHAGHQYLLNHGNSPALISGYNPCLEIFSFGGRSGSSGPAVFDGNWHHVVVGVDRDLGIHTFYVDGAFNTTITSGMSSWPGGGTLYVCGTGGDAMSGELDELAIYNLDGETSVTFASKLAQIASHYNVLAPSASIYNRTVLEEDPLFYWSFDEASGNALNYGRAGSGNQANELLPGSIGRTTSASTSGGIGLGRCANISGSALNRWISSGAMTMAGTSIVSRYAVEWWARTPVAGGQVLLANGTSVPTVFTGSPNELELSGGAGRTGSGGPAIDDGAWHHVVVGVDCVSGSHTFYVDGASNSSFRAVIAPWGAFQTNIVGGSIAGDAFGGQIDEVAVHSLDGVPAAFFQRALADLASHYIVQAASPTEYGKAVLVGKPHYYWTFDEAAGRTVNRGSAGSPLGNNDLASASAWREASTNTTGRVSLGRAAKAAGAAADEWFSGTLTGGAINNRYAIELWVKTSYSGQQYYLYHGANAPALISGWNPGLELYSASGRSGSEGPVITDGNWHHVVVGVDRTNNRHRFFVDGVADDRIATTISTWPAGQALVVCGSGGGNFFRGAIDELAVYNLDQTADFDAFLAGLAGHYSLQALPVGSVITLR